MARYLFFNRIGCIREIQMPSVQIDYPTLQFSIGYLQKWSPELAFGAYQLLVTCMAPSIINVELCNKFSGHSDPASALVVSLYLERLVESKVTCYWFSWMAVIICHMYNVWDWMLSEFFHEFSTFLIFTTVTGLSILLVLLVKMQHHETLGHIFSFFMKNIVMEMQESRGWVI